jgi:light-regulated signal transduction histidine kinase (bacteriophytochrome)
LHLTFGTSPVRDAEGRIVAVVGTVHDLTERKRAEQELQRSNAVLRQFAYAAAHDLQEPIRNVALASELIARRYAGKLDDDGRELLATSIEGAQRMHRMVRDLLEYTKVIDAGQAASSVCNSIQALNAALSNLKNAVEECAATIEHAELPYVQVHETHLTQLFQNLIANSLKYRRPDVPPHIRICCLPNGSNCRFSVVDNGIGFDPAYATRIFGLFRRLHPHVNYPGTGIGLAICERIVEHYGGKIWAESAPGQGATFHFVLPGQDSNAACSIARV